MARKEPTLEQARHILDQKPKEIDDYTCYFAGEYPELLVEAVRTIIVRNGYSILFTMPNIQKGRLIGVYVTTQQRLQY